MLQSGSFVVIIIWNISELASWSGYESPVVHQLPGSVVNHISKADVAYLNEDHQESCMFRRRASGLARPPLEGRWLQRVEASWFVCPPKCFDLLLLKKPVERHATGFRSTELRYRKHSEQHIVESTALWKRYPWYYSIWSHNCWSIYIYI